MTARLKTGERGNPARPRTSYLSPASTRCPLTPDASRFKPRDLFIAAKGPDRCFSGKSAVPCRQSTIKNVPFGAFFPPTKFEGRTP